MKKIKGGSMKQKSIRHGDLALIPVEKLPEGLKEAKAKVIMTGSHNNDHSFDNGKLYFRKEDDFVFGYLVAKNTMLSHVEHGKVIEGKKLRENKIVDGVYKLCRQNEELHNEMRPVQD